MLNIILFLIIIILLFKFLSNKVEKFKNYKKIVVKPQNSIYNKTTLNLMPNKEIQINIADNLSNVFPIENINSGCTGFSAVKNTNDLNNHLALVTDEIYFYYTNKKKHNIRFICTLGYEFFTLIAPFDSNIMSWKDIKNKKIGVVPNSSSHFILQKILTAFNIRFTNKVIPISFDSTKIIKDFNKKNIDCVFSICAHPDSIIQELNKIKPIRIIGVEGLDKKILTGVFSFYNSEKINLENYKLNNYIETLGVKINLLCNKDFDKNDCYNLINTIFSQFQYIKKNGDDNYKIQMRNFNPSKLYLDNLKYQFHESVYKFLKDIGMITNNKSYYCKFKAGVSDCNIKKINHFRLL